MSIERKLLSNTIYLFFDWFVVSILSFSFWFILAKTLPTKEYGIVTTSINFIMIISAFSILGINVALSKLISELGHKKNFSEAHSYIKMSFKLISIVLLIISFLLFIFSTQISQFLKLPFNSILIIIFSIISITFYTFSGSILQGFQNMKKYFITDAFGYFFKISITLFLLFIGFRYLSPLVGFCLSYLFIFVSRLNLVYFKTKSNSASYKKLFHYALPSLVTSITSSLLGYGNYIILTILKTPEITGIFAVAFTLSGLISILPNVLASALFPIISQLSIKQNAKNKQGYLFSLVLRYSIFLILPISILFLIFSKQAVLLFSSFDYLSATTYFPILIPAAVFVGLSTVFHVSLYGIGKPKIQRNTIVATTILFLLLSIPLTIYFSAVGFSMAYLISMMLLFVLNFIYIRKYLKPKFFIGDILKILFSSSIIALILYLIQPFIQNVFTLTLISIPIGLLYLILLLLTRFYRFEDTRLLEFFGKRIPFIDKYCVLLSNFIRKNFISK